MQGDTALLWTRRSSLVPVVPGFCTHTISVHSRVWGMDTARVLSCTFTHLSTPVSPDTLGSPVTLPGTHMIAHTWTCFPPPNPPQIQATSSPHPSSCPCLPQRCPNLHFLLPLRGCEDRAQQLPGTLGCPQGRGTQGHRPAEWSRGLRDPLPVAAEQGNPRGVVGSGGGQPAVVVSSSGQWWWAAPPALAQPGGEVPGQRLLLGAK